MKCLQTKATRAQDWVYFRDFHSFCYKVKSGAVIVFDFCDELIASFWTLRECYCLQKQGP